MCRSRNFKLLFQMKVKKFVLTPDERMLAFKGPMKMSNFEYSRKLNEIVMQLQDRMASEAALKLGFRGRIPLAKGRFLAMVEDIGGLLTNQVIICSKHFDVGLIIIVLVREQQPSLPPWGFIRGQGDTRGFGRRQDRGIDRRFRG